MRSVSSRARRRSGLSPAGAIRLKPTLNAFCLRAPWQARIAFDPVEFPHRYSSPRDIEVSGLIAAALAYGRADLFKPKVESLLSAMAPSPAAYVAELDLEGARRLLHGFVYRFNVAADLGVLLLGIGGALRRWGSLEALFREQLDRHGELRAALGGFTAALRDVPMKPLRRALGRERGLDHLLPTPLGPGAAKRLNLFLRWMVRGPDGVDFGIWRSVPPSRLIVPLDTHVGRIARYLGLTRRKELSWKTAEEVTASLRRVEPSDPVRYDFALCHHGMSGACPILSEARCCAACSLLSACRQGARVIASSARLVG
ncbi:MAG TPA: TIGR02757 family protein [Myxococcaceae bacterium]|nr:TIGR02757 family protein [Myxococcaceae bacterium]